ncbi:hypothetical protein IPZ58_08805 [Streptomyces roseoverticillatus]|uniref:hypothetical protein n=1 Tax=Streptomyces roseoverticillatus TaxID=66429 RepID=UPI001F41949B|nr:hypothetical protein [Streptomyces roseoverticillatus]MCF3101680.1 hypothetical protein [Streptomyces roseoverticillatus]
MGASRRTALMVSGALCGALALGAAGTAGASAGYPPPKPPTSPTASKASAPSPESLRDAASGGARAIDRNVVGQRAAEALKACRAAGPGAPETAGEAQRGPSCAQVEEHLGGLNRARAALAEEAAAAHPDLERMTTAATDAAAATAHLAKDGIDVSRRGPSPGHGHGHERYDGGGPGLLALVTNLLGGLVNALGGVVGGLTGLVGGVLGGILG